MREALGYHIDEMKNRLIEESVIVLQRAVRGYITRTRYEQTKAANLIIQTAVRGWIAR